ncbi:MAG: hypothetical protein ACJ8AI_26740 [Rhodopila sp.]
MVFVDGDQHSLLAAVAGNSDSLRQCQILITVNIALKLSGGNLDHRVTSMVPQAARYMFSNGNVGQECSVVAI